MLRKFDWKRRNRRACAARTHLRLFVDALEDRLLMAGRVTTDLPDYSPGMTALISAFNNDDEGGNFDVGETVRFQVARTDGRPDFPQGNVPWFVTDGVGGFDAHQSDVDSDADGILDWIRPDADGEANGRIDTGWFVEDQYLGSSLRLTAVGQTSGTVATTDFTDSPLVASVSVGAQTGSATTGMGTSVSYLVSVTKGTGSGTIGFSVTTALPAGVSVSFSPTTVGFAGGDASGTIKSTTLTVTTTAATPAGTTNFTVQALKTGGGGDSAAGTGTLVVNGVTTITPTFTASNKVYNGDNLASVVFAGFSPSVGSDNVTVSYASATFANANAGNAKTVTISGLTLSGTDAYKYALSSTSVTTTADITKADATVTVTPYSVTYDGSPHTATYTITGVNGETGSTVGTVTLNTTHTDAGTYASDTWSFTGAANYNDIASTSITNVINKASSTTTVTIVGGSFTYTGSAQTPATVSVTGAGGLSLSPTATYSDNVNAGTATASYGYAGDANHFGSTDSETFDIGKATATVTESGYAGGTYDGAAHTRTATVTGVGGDGVLYTTGLTGTDAGGYSLPWSYQNGNYADASGTLSFTIAKASSTTVVTIVGGPFTYTGAAQTPATVSVTGAGGLSLSPTATYSDNVNAGTATASYNFAGDANHEPSSDSETFVIGKADATVAVTPYSVTYDGSPHTATYTITGVNGETGATVGTATLNTTHTGAGTYASDTWSFTGAANYNDIASTSITNVINKASSTTTVTIVGGPFTYTGAAQTPATVSVTGAGGLNLTPTATYSDNVNAGTATASYNFAGDANHLGSTDSETFEIGKANATFAVSGYTGVYDGNAHGATGTATGVGGADLSAGLNLGSSFTNVPGGTANWTYTDQTGNYNNSSGSVAIVITKANAVISVAPYAVTYDGSAHTATGTATGVQGESLAGLDLSGTSHTNAGTYTDTWTFTDVTGNYNDDSDTVSDSIAKANATFAVPGYTGVYDGNAHGATGTATGVGGVDLSAGLNLGASFTNVPGGTAYWTYTDATGNYNDDSGTAAIVITKATATVTESGYAGGTYDGAAHTRTATVTGVGGDGVLYTTGLTGTDAGAYSLPWSYQSGNYADASGTLSFTIAKASSTTVVTIVGGPFTYTGAAQTPATVTVTGAGGLSLTPTATYSDNVNAGTATASYSFAGDANHEPSDDSETFVIGKADATVVVTPYTVTYNASPHTATYTLAGVNGETGATVGAVTLNTTHTNAGTYSSDSWSFTGAANYNDIASTTITNVINKASSTTTVTIVGGPFTYTGLAQTPATVTVTGAGGLSLTPTATYSDNVNAGTATASYSFAGDANHEPSDDSETFVIGKADATVVVTPYDVTYDASPHTATYTLAGVNGETGATVGTVTLNTTHTNAGTYASDSWSFTGAANYNDIASTSITNVINKANATISVSGYTGVYDGASHGATGTATGVLSEPLSGLNLGSSFTNVPGGTAYWTYTDATGNYNDDSGSVAIVITKASSTTTVTIVGGPFTYTGLAQTPATVSVTGAGGLNLSPTASYYDNVNAGTATASYSFAGDANHEPSDDSETFVIGKANATVVVTPYTVIYDGTSHMATGTAKGVLNETLTGLDLSGTTHTNAGTYTDTWTFTDTTGNYKNCGGTVQDVINKATATVKADTKFKDYGDANPLLTAVLMGQVAGGDPIQFTLSTTAVQYSPVGSYPIAVTLGSNPNYTITTTNSTLTVGSRAALVNYIGQTMWMTSGSSSTTAQVTLSASMQDPTGTALVGATVDFVDALTGTVLAKGVKVSPVAGSSSNTGTANTIVALSTGQYGAQSYEIQVVLTGNYNNDAQSTAARTATLVVARPAASTEIIGGGTIAAGGSAGLYRSANGADTTFSVGLKYNKSGTNPQGQIFITIPQADGSKIVIKSNSITSISVTNVTGGKSAVVYTKASIHRETGSTITTIEGNVSLRLDMDDFTDNTKDVVGFTVLSSKDSTLYYSSYWFLDPTTNTWLTKKRSRTSGTFTIN